MSTVKRDRTPGVDALIPRGPVPAPVRPPRPFITPTPVRDSRTSVEVSGRVGHDEKITVYFTAEEIAALDEFRTSLRRRGVRVDRGRIVRECIAMALADQQALEARVREER